MPIFHAARHSARLAARRGSTRPPADQRSLEGAARAASPLTAKRAPTPCTAPAAQRGGDAMPGHVSDRRSGSSDRPPSLRSHAQQHLGHARGTWRRESNAARPFGNCRARRGRRRLLEGAWARRTVAAAAGVLTQDATVEVGHGVRLGCAAGAAFSPLCFPAGRLFGRRPPGHGGWSRGVRLGWRYVVMVGAPLLCAPSTRAAAHFAA